MYRALAVIGEHLPADRAPHLLARGREKDARYALEQARRLLREGDAEAALATMKAVVTESPSTGGP